MSHSADTHVTHDSNPKTLSGYVVGLSLSFILTVAAFALVITKYLNNSSLYLALALLAVTQLLVQSVCFLRLNGSSEGRWNLLPFLFTLLVIVILAGGSLWIMYNLDYNMAH